MSFIPAFILRRISHRPNLVKIVDNIGWQFSDKILRMGVGLLVGVWIARYLGPEQFGLLNFAVAIVGMFGAVAGLGLQGIVVRDIVREPEGKDEILGTASTLQFVGGIFAYALILGTIFWLRPADLLSKILVSILGLMLLFKASDVAAYWFESQVQSKYIVWVQNGCFIVFTGVKITLILGNFPLLAFALATMFEALLVAILMATMLSFRGLKLKMLRFSLGRAKRLLSDSWPMLLSGIAIMTYMRIDQIMLGQLVGDEAVGVYSAALRISEIWYFIPMMIVGSVFPAIVEAKERSEAQYSERLQHLYILMVWLSVAVALPMTFLSTPIVILLFGEAYAKSGSVVAIHIWSSVFVFLGVASSQAFLAEDRQILFFQRTLLGALINIVLNILLIPEYGPIGAAVATVAAQFFVGILIDAMKLETRQMFRMKVRALNPINVLKFLKVRL